MADERQVEQDEKESLNKSVDAPANREQKPQHEPQDHEKHLHNEKETSTTDNSNENRATEEAQQIEQKIKIGKLEGPAKFINKQIEIQTLFISDAVSSILDFTPDMTMPMSDAVAKETERFCVYDKSLIDSCLTNLMEQRFLLIYGESEIGKGTVAEQLTISLRYRDNEYIKEILIVPPLQSQVRIDLHGLAGRDDFTGHILLMKNVFSRGNQDLYEFFASLDKDISKKLSDRLRKNKCYIILTSDLEKLPQRIPELLSLGILTEMPRLTNDLLRDGLNRRVEALLQDHIEMKENIQQKLTSELCDLIINRGKSMPRIRLFLDRYFLKILNDELTVDHAFNLIDDVEQWFVRDLSKAPESWAFAFTLALLDGLDITEGIPWFDFCHFHQVIREFVHDWVTDKSICKDKDVEQRSLNELQLLESTQSEIDGYSPLQLSVRFRNRSAPQMLRQIILKNNRALLVALVPILTEASESAEAGQHVLAARALGIIGEIDVFRIVRPLIEKWSAMESFQQRAVVGHLFQGAWRSSNSAYQRFIRSELEKLSDRDDRIWTAIAAYKQIGTVDHEVAFAGLKSIAERKLAKYFEDVAQVERRFENIERSYIATSQDKEDVIAFSIFCRLLMDFYQDLFADKNEVALSVQYAIVSLSITVGPIPVFSELRHWVNEQRGLGTLVSLVFLQERGIAAELANRLVEVTTSYEGYTKTELCSPVVAAMTKSGGISIENIEVVADFLESVFDGYYHYFPSTKGSLLTKTFLNHLKNLALSSYKIKTCREAMVELILKLLNSLNKSLNDRIYYWVRDDVDFVHGDLRPIRDKVLEKWMPS